MIFPTQANYCGNGKGKGEKKKRKRTKKEKKKKKKLNIVKHTVSKVLCFKNYMAFHFCWV